MLLGSCANPQRDRYEEAFAAIEREEQRRIAQSRAERESTGGNELSDGAATKGTSALSGSGSINANNDRVSQGNGPDIREQVSPASVIPSTIVEKSERASNGKQWWTQDYRSASTGESQCLVVSKAMNIGSGDRPSRVQIILTDKVIYVLSDASIVRNELQAGLYVDDNLPFVFDQYISDSTAAITKNYTTILNQLLRGSYITISAVVKTERGVPNLQLLEFSLKDFILAYARVDSCAV